MQGIQVSVSQANGHPDIVVVEIAGYIDTTTSSELERILQNLLREQKYKIVINLQNVDYISSAGWGIFISEIKNIRNQKGDLKLACMSESVNEVYELLEFSTILTSSETIADAVALFGGPKTEKPAVKPANEPPKKTAPAQPAAPKPAEELPETKPTPPISPAGNNQVAKAPAPPVKLTLIDRIKEVIKDNPEWGAWKIKNELNRTRGHRSKVGWGEVRSELKYSKLNNKSARYRFARGA